MKASKIIGERLREPVNKVMTTATRFFTSGFLAGLLCGLPGCASTPNQQKPPPTSASASATPSETSPQPPAKKPAVQGAKSVAIEELSVHEEAGQTVVKLKLPQPISQYRHFPLPQPPRVVLDIFGDSQRGEPETFQVGTNLVGAIRFTSGDGFLRMAVDIVGATVPPYGVTAEEGGLKLVVGTADPKATARRDLELVKGGKPGDLKTSEAKPVFGETSAQPADKQEIFGQTKKYSGQKLSLDFSNADIRNIFRLLAEISGKNIVVTDDVNRKVTVRLIEVPWDQALDLLVETNGLGKDEVENVIRISTASRLKSERDALAAAKKSEENLEPLQTAYLTVNYAKVIKGQNDTNTDKDLVDKIKTVLSPRGKIEADQRTNTLIIRDIKASIEAAQSFIGRLDTRTPQVLIESNLIETTPTFSRAIGIELESLFNRGRVRTSTRFIADAPFAGGPQPTPDTNLLIIPNSGFRFGYFGNNITSILSAAEAEGNVKIISRPSVVTLNNVESQIESANIIRVRTSAATVGEAGALREIRAGITLKVTPQVSADGFVLLNITAKSSTLDFGRMVDGIPQENTREAKANVLVRDGETVVLGGIMKDTSSNSNSGVPYLKDIPVFGWLFKKASWQKDFEELVVFITPRIMATGSESLPTADQLWREQMKKTQGEQAAATPTQP